MTYESEDFIGEKQEWVKEREKEEMERDILFMWLWVSGKT